MFSVHTHKGYFLGLFQQTCLRYLLQNEAAEGIYSTHYVKGVCHSKNMRYALTWSSLLIDRGGGGVPYCGLRESTYPGT